jgi:hypothetical protein
MARRAHHCFCPRLADRQIVAAGFAYLATLDSSK